MNHKETTHRLDDSPDPAASAPPHDDAVDVRDSGNSSSPLAHIDATAVSALSNKALARYEAYKKVLLAREQDEAAIISTLTLFVWDLSESR